MSKIQLSVEELEIFGDFDQNQAAVDFQAYQARMEKTGKEMDLFLESLPNWVTDDGIIFDLWLMTEKERAHWFEAHSPYLKSGSSAKPMTVGSMRI